MNLITNTAESCEIVIEELKDHAQVYIDKWRAARDAHIQLWQDLKAKDVLDSSLKFTAMNVSFKPAHKYQFRIYWFEYMGNPAKKKTRARELKKTKTKPIRYKVEHEFRKGNEFEKILSVECENEFYRIRKLVSLLFSIDTGITKFNSNCAFQPATDTREETDIIPVFLKIDTISTTDFVDHDITSEVLYTLRRYAQKHVDRFRDARKAHNQHLRESLKHGVQNSELTASTLHVFLKGADKNKFTIPWYDQPLGGSEEKARKTIYKKAPSKYFYDTEKLFKGRSEFEKTLGLQCENEFARVRNLIDQIFSIEEYVNEFNRIAAERIQTPNNILGDPLSIRILLSVTTPTD